MAITSVMTLIFLAVQWTCEAHSLVYRVPQPPVKYQYLAVEFENSQKTLGSCSEMKNTSPKSRCIIRITHRYSSKSMLFDFDDFPEKIVGSGVIIQKSIDNDIRSVTILTAFHIIVPQPNWSFGLFLVFYLLFSPLILLPLIIYIEKREHQGCWKIFVVLFCQSVLGACVHYCCMLFTYPFLFNSSIRLSVSSSDINPFDRNLEKIQCEVISSKMILSRSWWDDIG